MSRQSLAVYLEDILTDTIELLVLDFGSVQIYDDQRYMLTIAAQ